MTAVSEVVWRPDRATVEHANATRLVRRAGVADFAELVRRSQEDPAWFWPLAVEDLGLEFSQPWTQVLDDSRGPAWTTWFVGATLNIAHNCVHRWAVVPAGRHRRRRARRGRRPPRGDVRRALARRDATRGAARLARRRAGRPRRHLPADVARGRRRLARDRAHRRDPGADLLRLRRARRRAAPAGERGEGRDHAAGVVAPRQDGADASDPRRGDARVAERRARRARAVRPRRASRRAAAAAGRLRAPVPPHLHLGHDRQAEGRRARARRLPRLDRARGRVSSRRARRRRRALRDRHGLDHGPVDRRRRRRARRHDRFCRRRARLADTTSALDNGARKNA